jgi:hypothetical protein
MSTKARRAILRQADEDGRQLIIHAQAPNVIATAKSVVKV